MRFTLALIVATALATTAAAQCNTGSLASGFTNNTSVTGNALNIQTPTNSTANSLFTPNAQDNLAEASPGDAITITLSNTLGNAGAPLGIYFTPATAPFPQVLSGVYAGMGTLYLDTAVPFGAVVDGLGFVGPPNPFFAHPGPTQNFVLTVSLIAFPGINNTCTMLQSAVADPTTFAGMRMSNAVALGIRTAITSITPNFGPELSTVNVTSPGVFSGQLDFLTFNPAAAFVPATVPSSSGTLQFTVPSAITSGPVTLTDGNFPGIPSTADPENMNTFFAVTSSAGTSTGGATGGPLTLTPSPTNAGMRMGSVNNLLASAASTQTYTFTANAGDVVDLEAFSLNTAMTRILDGYGRTLNPNATNGCDLFLRLYQNTNTLPLVFDTGVTSATGFIIAQDDDSGPGFNPHVTFQVRATDTYQVSVSFSPNSPAAAFATGGYLLNVRVLAGVPSVTSFRTGTTQINARGFGQAVDILGNNFITGALYDIALFPVHGLQNPVLVLNVPATSPTVLTFTVPAFATGVNGFSTGAHYVQLADVAGGALSFVWDDTVAPGTNVLITGGINPDILFIRSVNTATPTTAAGMALVNNTTYALTQVGVAGGTQPAAMQLSFPVVIGQRIYVEAMGCKYNTALQHSLVDTGLEVGSPTTGTVLGVYNPSIQLFDPYLVTQAQNEDDGNVPFRFNWTYLPTPGIGRNAALLFDTNGSGLPSLNFTAFVTQPVVIGALTTSRAYFVNIVVI